MRVATIAGVFSFCVSWHSLTTLAQTQTADVEACRNGKASPDEMIAICSRAIGSGSLPALDLAELHTYRGWNWISKGDFDKAIADFSTTISLAPQGSAGYAGRGHGYLRKRDYRRAVEDLSYAIRIRPQSVVPWLNRGEAWIYLGRSMRPMISTRRLSGIPPIHTPITSGRRPGEGWVITKGRQAT